MDAKSEWAVSKHVLRSMTFSYVWSSLTLMANKFRRRIKKPEWSERWRTTECKQASERTNERKKNWEIKRQNWNYRKRSIITLWYWFFFFSSSPSASSSSYFSLHVSHRVSVCVWVRARLCVQFVVFFLPFFSEQLLVRDLNRFWCYYWCVIFNVYIYGFSPFVISVRSFFTALCLANDAAKFGRALWITIFRLTETSETKNLTLSWWIKRAELKN